MDLNSSIKKEITDWAVACLRHRACNGPFEISDVVCTQYSSVYKIGDTDKNIFYLKRVPSLLMREARMLDLFSSLPARRNVPKIIAKNDNLNCFITESCGDQSLKSIFGDDDFQTDLFIKGLCAYKDIQMLISNNLDTFSTLEIEDWRLSKFPNLFDKLLSCYNVNDIANEDINMAQKRLLENCHVLSNLNISDTVNHCDFGTGNILIDQNGSAKIIDWGEVSIGFPLLSSFLCIEKCKTQFDLKGTIYERLLETLFEGYNLSMKHRQTVLQTLRPITHLYYALTYDQLIRMADQAPEKWKNRVTMSLKAFIYYKKDIR